MPIIIEGTFESIPTNDATVLAYIREYQGERVLVVVNFSDQPAYFALGKIGVMKEMIIHNDKKEITDELLAYEAYAVYLK